LQVTTDVVALLDEWAARFFDELDYVKEGRNATLFAQQMAADLPQVRASGVVGVLHKVLGFACL
jgi:predicted unusual protein kinase regulating ubiquinone biosynthesis (AarF/ABC1/UbiB family)